jgi:hypothetical protein
MLVCAENIALVSLVLILDAVYLTSSHRNDIAKSSVKALPDTVNKDTLPAVRTDGNRVLTVHIFTHWTEESKESAKLPGMAS